MKRLILMRHAKSSWDHPDLDDFDRPLNDRGRASARAMGEWLRGGGHEPALALVSSSVRTRETFALLGFDCEVRFADTLYHASPRTMRGALREASGGTALMIGHNPGAAQLARDLLESAPQHPKFFGYPTCATLIAEFDIGHWGELDWRSGRAADFVVPRQLTG